MDEHIDWEAWCGSYVAVRRAALAGRKPDSTFDPPASVARRVAQATGEDARWLEEALTDPERKWFSALPRPPEPGAVPSRTPPIAPARTF